ncbi:hypothetical protein ES703_95806 [subsurface metagenome]
MNIRFNPKLTAAAVTEEIPTTLVFLTDAIIKVIRLLIALSIVTNTVKKVIK